MSDHWIAIVPKDPKFVPDPQAQGQALELFRAMAPDAENFEIRLSERIQLFDCGANLEGIICPRCGYEISIEWWQDRMVDDYDGCGFQLAEYSAPCCQASIRLDELQYVSPQAFARFGIKAMNPNIAEIPEEQQRKLEQILGTPLLTIHQHLSPRKWLSCGAAPLAECR